MPPSRPTLSRRILFRLCMMLGLLLPHNAFAWEIDTARSVVTFTYVEDGVPSGGTFDRIGGTLDYTQGQPQNSQADIRVDTASLDMGDTLREGTLAAGPWLDSKTHPYAHFILNSLEPLGDNKYTATGSLEIKGKARPVSFTLNLEDDGTETRVHGKLAFQRTDFDLRDTMLESLVIIGDTVRLDFNIFAFQEPEDIK